jgi:hypothetical protein
VENCPFYQAKKKNIHKEKKRHREGAFQMKRAILAIPEPIQELSVFILSAGRQKKRIPR